MPIKYLHPGSEHRKLNFLKIGDDSIAVAIDESHSVEVLGYNGKEQFGNMNNIIFFKTLAPSR